MQLAKLNFGTAFARVLRGTVLFALALLASTAHSAAKTVLVLGDSLSAEYGLARGAGWVALLQQRMRAEKIDATVINASISGETTSGGETRLPALLQKYRPELVIIELGANDGLRGLPFASVEANLRSMIQRAGHAGAKSLLVGMKLPPNYGRDYTERFHRLYTTVAKQSRVPLVPFMLEGVALTPTYFQADHLHPNAAADPIILNNVWPVLKPLLVRK